MVAIMTIHMFVPMMLQRQYWLLYGLGLALASEVSATMVTSAEAGHDKDEMERIRGAPWSVTRVSACACCTCSCR